MNKYNIGDEVWLLHHNTTKSTKIVGIYLESFEDTNIIYALKYVDGEEFYENQLFKTKEDLLKSL